MLHVRYGVVCKLSVSSFIAFITVLLLHGSAHAAPATFTVTNTNDSGAGSLRQAITDANANANPSDMDMIEFDIPGSGVKVFTPGTNYAQITEQVTIDGYSQPGAVANTATSPNPFNGTIMIQIQGGNGSANTGLDIVANNSIIRGLSVNNFTNNVNCQNSDSVAIQGNYIGTDATGLSLGTGTNSLFAYGCNNILIGGTNPQDRNIIAARTENGTAIQSASTDVVIYGNYVGLGADGLTSIKASTTISQISQQFGNPGTGEGLVIGGSGIGMMNVISGGTVFNVSTTANGGKIQGNYIGTDYTGSVNAGIVNGLGILTGVTTDDVLIGGSSVGEGNIIAGASGAAVVMAEYDAQYVPIVGTPSRVSVLGNSISDIGIFPYYNLGDVNIGIDLLSITFANPGPPSSYSELGPTPNDTGDGDSGPNGYINTPVLKSAQQIGNQLEITYDLDAADSPSDQYRIEFFANNEATIFGSGPGETYLGSATVSPGTNLTATLTVNGDYTNKALSATTTAVDNTTDSGFGSTSEFSQNIEIGSATDFDSDGILDSAEDQAPNNGDGNNDGILDRLQPTVTSYEIDSTGIYTTFVTDGCSSNGTVASIDATSLAKADTGKTYPYGLTDFTLNCSRGDTVNVTKYVFVPDQPSAYSLRKFNPNTEAYTDVTGSTITSQTVGTTQALVSTYSITDGGELDDDATANGIIVDPVGLATETSNTTDTNTNNTVGAPNTGLRQHWLLHVKD